MRALSIKELDALFAISGHICFTEGDNRLIFLEAENSAAYAKISLYGGQILSYKPRKQKEDLLFLSAKSHFQENKAIRGGIPLCWPWFGQNENRPKAPNHGFARTSWWTVAGTEQIKDNLTKIVLRLADTADPEINASVEVRLELTIGESLRLELTTANNGPGSFAFTQALHSYFAVGDVSKVIVLGLDKIAYIDKQDDNAEKIQRDPVRLTESADRIYKGWHGKLGLEDPVLGRAIRLTPEGARDIVVWNPWAENAAAMPDLDADEYRRFICIEAGNVLTPLILAAGAEYRLAYEMQAS